MIEVIESPIPEILAESVVSTVVDHVDQALVLEITSAGADILTETAAVDVITDVQTQSVVQTEIETMLLEAAEQGPPGPSGPAATVRPGKTLVWTFGVLTGVLMYSDAAKTALVERRELDYSAGKLSTVRIYSGGGALLSTQTMVYSGGVLTGVVRT